ncbi:MAG: type II CAAX endopeptidase family protein [Gemmatimonadaceae bacterium]
MPTPTEVPQSSPSPAAAAATPGLTMPARMAVFLGSVLGAVLGVGGLIAAVVRVIPEAALQPTVQIAPLALAFLIAHWVMARWVHRDGGAYVGLDRRALDGGLLVQGALLGVLAIGVPSLLLLVTGELRFEQGEALGSTTGTLLPLLLLLVPAALWEELAFRGYLLSALREQTGTWPALLATSALFGVIHLTNPGATALSTAAVALAGIFLGLVRIRTGSLYAAWAAHLAWNLTMAVGLRTPVSGTSVALPGYRIVDAGPDWLTGGAWGPEGGCAAMLSMGVASWYLVRRQRREERTT